MTTKQETALRYLKAAVRSVETYGANDPIGLLVGEIYGAAAYGEGDITEIVGRLVAARAKAIEEGA